MFYTESSPPLISGDSDKTVLFSPEPRTQRIEEFSHTLALWTSLAFASMTCDVVSDLIPLQETKGITVIHYLFQTPYRCT